MENAFEVFKQDIAGLREGERVAFDSILGGTVQASLQNSVYTVTYYDERYECDNELDAADAADAMLLGTYKYWAGVV